MNALSKITWKIEIEILIIIIIIIKILKNNQSFHLLLLLTESPEKNQNSLDSHLLFRTLEGGENVLLIHT